MLKWANLGLAHSAVREYGWNRKRSKSSSAGLRQGCWRLKKAHISWLQGLIRPWKDPAIMYGYRISSEYVGGKAPARILSTVSFFLA